MDEMSGCDTTQLSCGAVLALVIGVMACGEVNKGCLWMWDRKGSELTYRDK